MPVVACTITCRCTNKHSPCSFLLGFCYQQVETFGELRSELEVLAEAYEVGRWTGVRHGSASEFAVLVCAAMAEAYPVPAMPSLLCCGGIQQPSAGDLIALSTLFHEKAPFIVPFNHSPCPPHRTGQRGGGGEVRPGA
jgi:hypothetical protein